MNTYTVINRRPVSTVRVVELTAYVALATLLIGQILVGGGAVSFADVMLVYVGAVAGLLVSCRATPISAGLQHVGRVVRVPNLWGMLPFRRRKSGPRMGGGNTGDRCTA